MQRVLARVGPTGRAWPGLDLCCLCTANGPGQLADVLNTGPFELRVGQEVSLIAPFVQRLCYLLKDGQNLFSFPLTVAHLEAEKACLYYKAVKMASLGWADWQPDTSVLLEYLSPHIGNWAGYIAQAATADDAPLYTCAAIELNHLCDLAEGLYALLPRLRNWLADVLEQGEAAEDSAARLISSVVKIWPGGQGQNDDSPYGTVTDLLGASSWN